MADWSLERTLQRDFRALDGFNSLRGNAGLDSFREGGRACEADFGLDVDASCLYDLERGGDDFGSDAVAGDDCDFSRVE